MTTTPARTEIRTAVFTKLAAILPTNGYRSTVRTVDNEFRPPSDKLVAVTRSDPRVWIGCWLGDGTGAHEPTDQIHESVNVELIAHVYGADRDARNAARDAIEDDIIAALCGDQRLGGACTSVSRILTQTDEGGTVPAFQGATGSIAMRFTVEFFRTTGVT